MTEKPLNLLWSLAPESQERFLKDLNRLGREYNLLGSTFGQLIGSGELHKFTALDFEHARIGAAAKEGAKAGAAASVAPRKNKLRKRNIEMALKFVERRRLAIAAGSNISESDLKQQIGRAMAELGRSASIEAIDDGLKHLGLK